MSLAMDGDFRRDDDYRPDPLEPHENRSVRRTVDDVNDIIGERRFRLRVFRQGKSAVMWIIGVPAALAGVYQSWLLLLSLLAKFTGKAP